MQSPSRYLRRMALFLAAVAVAAAVTFPILAHAFMVNPALNGLICGVVLVGVLYEFRQVLALAPELRWAEAFQKQQVQLSGAPEPRLLAPAARMFADRPEGRRFVLSPQATRSLLDSLSDRLDETRDISRYFTGLTIFLGLLGTFWGLMETVRTIGGVIADLQIAGGDITQVFADLKAGLEAPLAGMGTAFSSSLLGLSGSLVIGFLDLQLGQAQNSFFNQIEDWMSGATKATAGAGPVGDGDGSVPAYIGALLEQTAESLTELQRLTSRGDESSLAAMREIRELGQRLDLLTEHMHTQQQVMLKLAENQSSLLQGVHALAKAEGGLDADTRNALKALPRAVENGLAAVLDEMTRGRSELSRDVRSEIKVLARTIAAVAEAGKTGREP
ncbi:MotA/TolQ/ExbB proton channel family protein [uncultured Alphaproteobacteria bacterium]|uniref:MotA/TolQ/ExbB proton channel family protein n=1 Tax=uncultured Alphaproteobacteria bacterium TaxID=91750 RepID=A0A212JED4_9PROT|nr:MotA/TolQ/ExbB proton channel family protein [uncultured Alphaproteobacteria bacterium]